MVNWKCLVPDFHLGKISISGVETSEKLMELKQLNSELSEWLNQIERRNWRCLDAHEARAYVLTKLQSRYVIWLSWVGYRGSRWHLVKCFSLNGNSIIEGDIKSAIEVLLERYQEAWNAVSDLN